MKTKALIEKISYIFFPKRCRYCGKLITPDRILCDACENNLPVINTPICKNCGYNKKDCNCKKRKEYYKSIAAPFYYEGAIKAVINRMKFKENPLICEILAEDMLKVIKREYGDIHFDMIFFVPFSDENLKKRRFNHSQLIARKIGESLGVEVVDGLYCINNIKSQHSLSGFERRGNVFGAYELKSDAFVTDKTILLVDDIKTTGSTLSECAKILKIRGANEVYAITFAISKLL